ncbi:MAG TPA: FeS assembly SUF system protein [Bacteroidales bacterium]|nr:FeS assembly SUF system protein [Bacteroidales bacterium]
MDSNEYMETEARIIEVLKTIYDPEMPVNIYDLGLVYEISLDKENVANITMTLTAPGCPMADMIMEEVKYKVAGTMGVKDCNLTLTFDPPWDKGMMTDEAKLELGFL